MGSQGTDFFGIKYRYFVSAAEQIPTNDLQAASPIGRELEFVSCQCLEILRVIGPAVPGHHVCRPPVSVPVFDVDHDAQILPNLSHSCHWPNLLRKKVLTNSGWCFLYKLTLGYRPVFISIQNLTLFLSIVTVPPGERPPTVNGWKL